MPGRRRQWWQRGWLPSTKFQAAPASRLQRGDLGDRRHQGHALLRGARWLDEPRGVGCPQGDWVSPGVAAPGDTTPCATLGSHCWVGADPKDCQGLRLFLVPAPAPRQGGSCVTLVTHRAWFCPSWPAQRGPWVPGRWGRTFSWGCCAGAARGHRLPQTQLWREEIGNVPGRASQGCLGRAEWFGGGVPLQGKGGLQMWDR